MKFFKNFLWTLKSDWTFMWHFKVFFFFFYEIYVFLRSLMVQSALQHVNLLIFYELLKSDWTCMCHFKVFFFLFLWNILLFDKSYGAIRNPYYNLLIFYEFLKCEEHLRISLLFNTSNQSFKKTNIILNHVIGISINKWTLLIIHFVILRYIYIYTMF